MIVYSGIENKIGANPGRDVSERVLVYSGYQTFARGTNGKNGYRPRPSFRTTYKRSR